MTERFGKPSSAHWAGREARDAVEAARQTVASFIHASPSEVFFTAGGSEGDNMAIKGILMQPLGKGGHIITSAVEHSAVLKTCRSMERYGFDVTIVPADSTGMIEAGAVRRAIRKDTRLTSIMYVNNETGNIFPLRDIAAIGREHGIPVHTDAVQAIGKVPIDVKGLGVDILTASGHKFNAPKGIGFQFIKEGTNLVPLISGGHHEGGAASTSS